MSIAGFGDRTPPFYFARGMLAGIETGIGRHLFSISASLQVKQFSQNNMRSLMTDPWATQEQFLFTG